MAEDNFQEDLEDLYENAPCGYVSILANGRIFKLNRTLALWLGHDAQDLVGSRFLDLLNIAGRIFYETHFAPLLRMQGFFNEVALDFLMKNGERLPVLVNAAERKDDKGHVTFTRLTIFKATDRRRYEQELVKSQSDTQAKLMKTQASLVNAEAVSELREQFIAVLGHDLRNPLSALQGGLRLHERGGDPERLKQITVLMHQSIGRMSGLIDNMLDFARGRLGGGITLERNLQDIAPTIRHVAAELQTSHPEQTIELRLDLQAPVLCDAGRIGQLLSNLLANALTHGDAQQPVALDATSRPGVFHLSVANAGEQIPDDVLADLFKPFARGEKSSLQGLGLGLYISSEIAKAHGGQLVATSTANETRFSFVMES